MQAVGFIFDTFFFSPIINVLVLILKGLEFINVPGALGFSIIILTVAIRLLIWPLFTKQTKSAKKMYDLKPHLEELKKEHGDNKQAYMKAQMELYKKHGVSPMGGCLPALVQIPIFIALYQTILTFFGDSSGVDKINSLLYNSAWKLESSPSLDFFGLNLASKPSDFATAGFFILFMPPLTAVLQLLQSKMMLPQAIKKYPTDSQKEKKEKQTTEDAMASVQSQMVYLMPLMIGFFSYTFPVGLSLYWNTFTVFGIIQQYKIMGWGGLLGWKNKVLKIINKS